jgi:predicted esterase
MSIKEHHTQVTKTARYYTSGELNSQTKNVLIVLHGHRQLAGEFIKTFTELTEKGYYVIAPEGLSKFYLKGDYGDIGATWMTKEDRQNEINDYVNYLDNLYKAEIRDIQQKYNYKVTALGFSQGAATLSRWLAYGKSRVDKAIFWCGNLAHDLDYSVKSNLHKAELLIVYSDNDPYLTINFMESHIKMLKDNGLNPKTYMFSGVHEINMNLLNNACVLYYI